jgi:hypothetical protein
MIAIRYPSWYAAAIEPCSGCGADSMRHASTANVLRGRRERHEQREQRERAEMSERIEL